MSRRGRTVKRRCPKCDRRTGGFGPEELCYQCYKEAKKNGF